MYNTKYAYDDSGTRKQMSKYNTTANTTDITDYTYDANNRMTSIVNDNDTTKFYYDDNGNTIAEQKKTYTTGTESADMVLSGRFGGNDLKNLRV